MIKIYLSNPIKNLYNIILNKQIVGRLIIFEKFCPKVNSYAKF